MISLASVVHKTRQCWLVALRYDLGGYDALGSLLACGLVSNGQVRDMPFHSHVVFYGE